LRSVLACLCQGLLLAAAWLTSDSLSGFLLFGLSPALLLDRYLFRQLPWSAPPRWRRELAARIGAFIGGAAAALVLRWGYLSAREALWWGLGATLLVFGAQLFGRLLRAADRRLRPALPLPRWARGPGLLCAHGVLFTLGLPLLAIHPPHTTPGRAPDALGLAYEEVRFGTADGLGLAGWLVPAEGARGNVLFCHGHGRNRGQGSALLPTLHRLGLNVLTFDFRGHGDSPGRTTTFGRREVQDVLAAAAYLRDRCPGLPLFVVGVSYGAAVSLQALPQLPDVRGVWSEGCFDRFGRVADHCFGVLPEWMRGPVLSAYEALLWLDTGTWLQDRRPAAALAGLHVPIYFCHARADDLVPWAGAESMYEGYAGPKWHFWAEGATHANIRNRCRAEYLRRLSDFLEERLAESAAS
jgi:alpha-beta hydrolase superfamily lysophospholipase